MIDFFFIDTADSKVGLEIGRLYREAGWWSEAPEQLDAVENIVRGSHCFLIVLAESAVVGMGRAISDGVSDAYVQDVTVLRDWRGQGIAKTIVKKIVERLKKDKIDWIGVIAERGTHKLYEDLGFIEIPDSKALLLKDNTDELPET